MKKIAVLANFYDNRAMTENNDPKNSSNEMIYMLDVRIPDKLPTQIEVINQVVAGIDPRNDIILIDKKILNLMDKELSATVVELEKKIFAEAGVEFNVASPKQLKEILIHC